MSTITRRRALIGLGQTITAAFIWKNTGQSVISDTSQFVSLEREIFFDDHATVDDRFCALGEMIDAEKMKDIIRKYKESNLLVNTGFINKEKSIVFQYYFSDDAAKAKFEYEIKAVSVYKKNS